MTVLTVREFNQAVKGILDQNMPVFTVRGELSDLNIRRGNLAFYSLKDEDGVSSVKCFQVMTGRHFPIDEGMEVQVTGRPSIFQKNAGFHVRVQVIEPVGEGAFRKAFEKLKAALEKEGLFAQEHKKPIPRFPMTIALVTSPDADAKKDVLRIMKNRWTGFSVKFFPAAVQGASAVNEIVRALSAVNETPNIDVCILTRGGGSLEDLMAFNAEEVARAIYASRVPVVCGIGHEADVTIADLIADVRASTPSNAAERVVPDRRDVLREIEVFARQMRQAMDDHLQERTNETDDAVRRIAVALEKRVDAVRVTTDRALRAWSAFRERLVAYRLTLTSSGSTMRRSLGHVLAVHAERITQSAKRLQSLNPLAILKRGYSVTTSAAGVAVRSVQDVHPGDDVTTRLHDGAFYSRVEGEGTS